MHLEHTVEGLLSFGRFRMRHRAAGQGTIGSSNKADQ